uniref:Mitochondrial-processing peptidase subunit alpha-like n=1 Tax=Tanacetum cinerariifolium TaxID=118510 RepID=A0A6L2MJW4_TANCI|nr:mitochondrial-processing peptidase subunit alpha-like [Tanacetum cinerariifolium]
MSSAYFVSSYASGQRPDQVTRFKSTKRERAKIVKGLTNGKNSPWVGKALRFASSSAVAANSSSGGIFSFFTGGSSASLPPLDFPLKGIEIPPSLPDHVETGKTKVTTLPNGVRIASEASASPAASIGLYVNSGSIYETPVSFGATHLLERMAFKSTANRTHLRLVREVEAIGGNVTASASREQMGYTFDALKTYVPQMVELLVDSARNQVFLDWEIKEQIEKVKAEISEYANNPEALLLEAVHSAGYSGALANPLLASEGSLNRLDSTVLEEFVAENYTAPRIVLAASGVEHEELLKYAEPLLSDLPGGAQVAEPQSVYVGGDHRVMADTGRTSFALAFELPGGWLKEKDAMTLTVLQMVASEDIGRQILTYGERKPVEFFLKAVDEVTAKDIASLAQKLLSSPLTMASHGDVIHVPTYDSMLMGGGGSFSAGGPGKGMYSRLYLNVLNEYPDVYSFSAFNSIYNHTAVFGIQATTGGTCPPGPPCVSATVNWTMSRKNMLVIYNHLSA